MGSKLYVGNLSYGTTSSDLEQLFAQYGTVPKLVMAARGAVWSPNGGAVTEVLVKEAQGLGLKVIPWTINNPADMERLIDWGVDGIITDYPGLLLALLERGSRGDHICCRPGQKLAHRHHGGVSRIDLAGDDCLESHHH